eukprot:2146569-Rhodomonas_salina.2
MLCTRAWLLALAVALAWLSASEALTPASPEMHTAQGQKLDTATSRDYGDRMEDAIYNLISGFIIFTLVPWRFS